MKKRFFWDYSDHKQLKKRWKTKPNILSPEEIAELFDILKTYFGNDKSPIEQIKLLIKQIQQLKKVNEGLKNPFLKIKNISYQNDAFGILQILKKIESNTISFSSSSVNKSSEQPENLLNYNDSVFCSQRKPNQWLSLKLHTKKILLSGYLLRSCPVAWANIKTWKLEGSNDNINWILIDHQIDRNWVTKDLSEMYFPVKAKEPFSNFRFTQTGPGTGNFYFQLNYLEQF
jgi:hypothetical protein